MQVLVSILEIELRVRVESSKVALNSEVFSGNKPQIVEKAFILFKGRIQLMASVHLNIEVGPLTSPESKLFQQKSIYAIMVIFATKSSAEGV